MSETISARNPSSTKNSPSNALFTDDFDVRVNDVRGLQIGITSLPTYWLKLYTESPLLDMIRVQGLPT